MTNWNKSNESYAATEGYQSRSRSAVCRIGTGLIAYQAANPQSHNRLLGGSGRSEEEEENLSYSENSNLVQNSDQAGQQVDPSQLDSDPRITQAKELLGPPPAAFLKPEIVIWRDEVAWVDIANFEPGCAEDAGQACPSFRTSVIQTLKRLAGVQDRGVILIPENLESVFPYAYQRLNYAAKLVKSQLVQDPQRKIMLRNSPIWDIDSEARDRSLLALNDASRRDEKNDVFILDYLLNALCKLPNLLAKTEWGVDSLCASFLKRLLCTIYVEETCKISRSKSSTWWNIPQIDRTEVIDAIGSCVGSIEAGQLILNAIEILLRRLVSTAGVATNPSSQIARRLRSLSAVCFKSPADLYKATLKVRTEKVVKKIPDPNKKGRFIDKASLIKKVQRPCIPDGPMLPAEKIFAGKLNSACKKLDAKIHTLSVVSNATDPQVVVSSIAEFSSMLYGDLAPYARMIVERRKATRAMVRMAPKQVSSGAAQPAVANSNRPNAIQPQEWMDAATNYINCNRASMRDMADRLIQSIFQGRLGGSIEFASERSEEAILDALLRGYEERRH